jgi:ABC-type antimicrobial peptide transport system permease subunit
VEALVRSLDPNLPLSRNQSYSSLVDLHFLPRRLAGIFAGVLGLMGVFLATVGLYGLLSEMVVMRSWELALRMALGASPGAVRRPVLLGGLALVGTGLVLGIPLAVAASNIIRTFLYGMNPMEPHVFGAIILIFLLIGLAATYLPACRATRSDPARIFRSN